MHGRPKCTGTNNATSGLQIGIAGVGTTQFIQNENQPLAFCTRKTSLLRYLTRENLHCQNLACGNCLVMVDEKGKLFTQETHIDKLYNKIALLEQKLTAIEGLLAKKE